MATADEAENPYAALARGWHQRLARLERQNGALFVVTLLLGLACVALGAGVLWLAFFRLPDPYVLEVDAEDRVRYGGLLDERLSDRDDLVPSELVDFVEFWRTVTPDRAMQRKLVRRLHCMVAARSPAYAEMRAFYGDAEADPFRRGRSVSVEPRVTSVLKLTGQTWSLEWQERARRHDGSAAGEPVPFRANVIIDRGEVEGECIRSNPLGLYVTEVSWTNRS